MVSARTSRYCKLDQTLFVCGAYTESYNAPVQKQGMAMRNYRCRGFPHEPQLLLNYDYMIELDYSASQKAAQVTITSYLYYSKSSKKNKLFKQVLQVPYYIFKIIHICKQLSPVNTLQSVIQPFKCII